MNILSVAFLVLLLTTGCSRRAPLTSSHASTKDVRFLEIPTAATDIRYWDDGQNQVAVFRITESQFRSMFPHVTFLEIAEPTFYSIKGFGDPTKNLYDLPESKVAAANGLFHQKIEANGGGPTIIYDRSTGLGYYDYSSW